MLNYSPYPNLLLIVNRSKNIDVNEIMKPKIIKGFDFSLVFSIGELFIEDRLSSFFLIRRFEKGLITANYKYLNMFLPNTFE